MGGESISAAGTVQICFDAEGGYVPPTDVLHSSADCGDEGKILQCTFTSQP